MAGITLPIVVIGVFVGCCVGLALITITWAKEVERRLELLREKHNLLCDEVHKLK